MQYYYKDATITGNLQALYGFMISHYAALHRLLWS